MVLFFEAPFIVGRNWKEGFFDSQRPRKIIIYLLILNPTLSQTFSDLFWFY